MAIRDGAAGDRIVSDLSRSWLLRSAIAPASSSDPDGCTNARFANKAGATKMAHSTTIAGIDTSKLKLDIAVPDGAELWQVENTPAGWNELASRLAGRGITRAAIEASGGYERGVVDHLRRCGCTVLVLQPAQVRDFARARRRLAKNDALDAALIAQCAEAVAEPREPPDPDTQMLAHQLTFVEQIEDDLVRLKTRLEHIHDKRLQRLVAADIARLKLRRAAELKRIAAAIKAHPHLARRLELVASVPGIGERTAIALIVRMPELGSLSREQAASLAGLAPFDHDSGQHRGARHIAAGRGRLRRSLYAAALPAAFRWNPALVRLYQRLIARGKAHKAALVACARKLLVYANTVVARGTPWIATDTAAS